jgi:hypothetical protein
MPTYTQPGASFQLPASLIPLPAPRRGSLQVISFPSPESNGPERGNRKLCRINQGAKRLTTQGTRGITGQHNGDSQLFPAPCCLLAALRGSSQVISRESPEAKGPECQIRKSPEINHLIKRLTPRGRSALAHLSPTDFSLNPASPNTRSRIARQSRRFMTLVPRLPEFANCCRVCQHRQPLQNKESVICTPAKNSHEAYETRNHTFRATESARRLTKPPPMLKAH